LVQVFLDFSLDLAPVEAAAELVVLAAHHEAEGGPGAVEVLPVLGDFEDFRQGEDEPGVVVVVAVGGLRPGLDVEALDAVMFQPVNLDRLAVFAQRLEVTVRFQRRRGGHGAELDADAPHEGGMILGSGREIGLLGKEPGLREAEVAINGVQSFAAPLAEGQGLGGRDTGGGDQDGADRGPQPPRKTHAPHSPANGTILRKRGIFRCDDRFTQGRSPVIVTRRNSAGSS
jgi:hypothetical protein